MCAIGLAPNLIITVKENKSDDRGSEKTFEMHFFVHLEKVKTRLNLLCCLCLEIEYFGPIFLR